jgi:hypothetical protein
MRPDNRWHDVVRVLNAKRERSNGPPLPLWRVEGLKRAVKRFVADRLADPVLLQPAGRKFTSERLVTLVAGVSRANPELEGNPIKRHHSRKLQSSSCTVVG